MKTIQDANSMMDRLTFQRQHIEYQQSTSSMSIPNFKNINDRAQGVFLTLSSGWTCPCQEDHAVNLRLEPRMEDVSSDDDDDETGDESSTRNRFHVLFQYKYRCSPTSSASLSPWAWDEAKVHAVCKRRSSASLAIAYNHHSGKGVRFAAHTKRKTEFLLSSDMELYPTKDLCSAIRTLQKPQRNVCLTLLDKMAKLNYGLKIYPTKLLPQDTEHWSVSTLRSILQRGRRFRNRDRVYLAVILASSVLQLHETAWLEDDWGIDNIYFVERAGSTSYDQPFVSRRLGLGQETLSAVSKCRARMIRNRPLFALGVALIELWHSESLSNLHESEDGEQDSQDMQSRSLTMFNTADRVAGEIAQDAGTRYSDAVQRCIRCDFNLSVSSLADVKFQKAVYQGVVNKLQESYDFMTQASEA